MRMYRELQLPTRMHEKGFRRYGLFGLAFTGEVRGIEHDPAGRITFEMIGDIEGRIRWDFEAIEDGTRVTYAAEYDLGLPTVAGLLLAPIIDRFNECEIQHTLKNLQQRLESGPTE